MALFPHITPVVMLVGTGICWLIRAGDSALSSKYIAKC